MRTYEEWQRYRHEDLDSIESARRSLEAARIRDVLIRHGGRCPTWLIERYRLLMRQEGGSPS
jgi:hypothetical protein